jgi:hypothetical protein
VRKDWVRNENEHSGQYDDASEFRDYVYRNRQDFFTDEE